MLKSHRERLLASQLQAPLQHYAHVLIESVVKLAIYSKIVETYPDRYWIVTPVSAQIPIQQRLNLLLLAQQLLLTTLTPLQLNHLLRVAINTPSISTSLWVAGSRSEINATRGAALLIQILHGHQFKA